MSYNKIMRRFYEREEPVARDAYKARLTPEQIYQINYYLDRAASGSFSKQFIKDLHYHAHRRFQEARRKGDKELADRLGPEAQVLEHVLKVAFRGDQPTGVGPDPKHMEYIAHIERKAAEGASKKDYRHPNYWVIPDWHPDTGDPEPAFEMLRVFSSAVMEIEPERFDIVFNPYAEGSMQVLFEEDGRQYASLTIVDREDTPTYALFLTSGEGGEVYFTDIEEGLQYFEPEITGYEEEVEAVEEPDDELAFLEPELRADLEPLSEDPEIASIQQELRRLVFELRDAMEDEEPPFIITKIQRRIATTHERLTGGE